MSAIRILSISGSLREGQPVHPAVLALRAEIGWAHALLLYTPEQAGALPGALKNLLEWPCRPATIPRRSPPVIATVTGSMTSRSPTGETTTSRYS
jgi:NAD(P)H-dependent FMN reductase